MKWDLTYILTQIQNTIKNVFDGPRRCPGEAAISPKVGGVFPKVGGVSWV